MIVVTAPSSPVIDAATGPLSHDPERQAAAAPALTNISAPTSVETDDRKWKSVVGSNQSNAVRMTNAALSRTAHGT